MKKPKLFNAILFASLLVFGARTASAADAKTEILMQGILNHYLIIQEKLAADTTSSIENEAQGILRKVSEFFNKPCKPDELGCASVLQKISAAAAKIKGNDINAIRNSFQELSKAMVTYWKDFKPKWPEIFVFTCPMANENRGAPWLQRGPDLKNPYFGKSMSACGEPVK